MLQSIHNATKNWFGYIILFIMTIFLVGAFALWGVGDIFRGGVDTTIAEVGGRNIERTDYDRELKAAMRDAGQGQADITMEQAKALGLDKEVLDRMIERLALDERARALGLTATDATVRTRLEQEQAFQGTDGRFDRGRFERLLQSAGYDESEYIEGTRSDVARQQYVLAGVAAIGATPRMTRLLLDYLTEQRTAEYFTLTPDVAGGVPEPSEAQLAAFHKAHAPQFSTPEYREIEYVSIGVAEVSNEIPVSDADLQKSWELRKDEFQKLEVRELEQIAFPNEAAAKAAYERIQHGTPFATVAHDAGKSDADIKLGSFTEKQLDPRLVGAAFKLPDGGVSAPVQGPFNWVILRVAHITPGEAKTFEQVHDQLRSDLIKERAVERISDMANKFEDERASDKPFAQSATAAGVTAHHVVVDNKGLAPDGTKAPIPAAPEFLAQVFATESGNESDMFEDAEHAQDAVRVIGIRAPALKPLDQMRTQVRDAWLAEQRANLLENRAKALAAQMQREGSVAGAARTIGRTPTTSAALARNSAGDVFSQDALTKLFNAPPGTSVYARLGKGDGYALARVTKVTHPSPDPGMLMQLRTQLSQQLEADLGQTLARAARAEAGVEVHEHTLQQTIGETQ